MVLGVALHAGGGDIDTDLARLTSPDLERAYREWSGRWVLIDDGDVHLDCSGMFGVFHSDGLVASAPVLLPGVSGGPSGLRREHLLSFMPGPLTGIPGVERVLPSQILSLRTGGLRSRPLPHPKVVQEVEAPAMLDRLADNLLQSVRKAAELGPVTVPLTAGYDSRLALAACVAAGLAPRLITQVHPGTSRADLTLPPLMAERLGLRHDLIPPGTRDAHRGELYDRQVSGLIREADREFLERDQFRWLHEGDVILRGIVFDDTRSGEHDRLAGVELDAGQLSRAFGADPAQRASLTRWVDWVRQDPQPISLHDRFCLELRSGSYASTTELALDLMAPCSTIPGNSTVYQESALSLPLDWRLASRHHTELVARWAPQIADVPYNPPRRGLDKARRIAGAVRRRARQVRTRLSDTTR